VLGDFSKSAVTLKGSPYRLRVKDGDYFITESYLSGKEQERRVEFTLGSRTIRFKIKCRPWMLRLMRRGKFLRRMLPAWHAKERAFRSWYFDVADQFAAPADSASYATWLKVLRLPEEVTGYREVRYPKMELAQKRAEEMLASFSNQHASKKMESL